MCRGKGRANQADCKVLRLVHSADSFSAASTEVSPSDARDLAGRAMAWRTLVKPSEMAAGQPAPPSEETGRST